MVREQQIWLEILNRISYQSTFLQAAGINLGASSGSLGGVGVPPGGIFGQLGQTYVAGDTDESFIYTSGSISSLLSNLNNIRAYEKPATYFFAHENNPADYSVVVMPGIWHYGSGSYLISAGGQVTFTPPATNNRIDLLTVGTTGILNITQGTAAVTPVAPSIPSPTSGSMPIAYIYLRSSGSAIHSVDKGEDYIQQDVRPFIVWGLAALNFDAATPQAVGSSGVTGTSGSASHGDHAHQGVSSVSAAGGAYAYGNIQLNAGANVTLSQTSGSITIASSAGGGGTLDPTIPQAVGVSSVVGTSGSSSHGDHVHQGVRGIYTAPSTIQSGIIDLEGLNGITVTQSSGSFTLGTSGSFVPVIHDINGVYHGSFPLNPANGGTGKNNGTNTLIIPATGTAAIGAGTITSSSTNDVTGANHTHAAGGTFPAAGHNILSETHSDTNKGPIYRGDIITAQGTTPTWDRLGRPLAKNFLTSNGIDVIWSSGSIDLSSTSLLTLETGVSIAATTSGSTVVNTGAGISGRIAEWSDKSVIQNSTLIKTGVGVLTLDNNQNGQLSLTNLNSHIALFNFTGLTSDRNYIFPDQDGNVPLGAGTLTVSTVRNVTASDHLHPITSSSATGIAASLLASDTSGSLGLEGLTLGQSLGVGYNVIIPATTGTAGQGLYFSSSGGNVASFQALDSGGASSLFYTTNRYFNGASWQQLNTRVGGTLLISADTIAFYSFAASSSTPVPQLSVTNTGVLTTSGGIIISGTTTGATSSTSFTNVTNTTLTNAYVVKGGQAASTINTGWIKIFIGTNAAWVPYWQNATP